MKLIDVEYKFDNSKVTFLFTAEGRIDFRELVRDLASIFKTRIELRQIGIRDEVKRIGGNGICGRELCCCSYLRNFETVSIKMAKEQNTVLNPSKITGCCGRLMCCLKYEQEGYEEKNARLPKAGAIVETTYKKYNVDDIKIIKDGANKKYEEIGEKEELEELERLEKLEEDDIENY